MALTRCACLDTPQEQMNFEQINKLATQELLERFIESRCATLPGHLRLLQVAPSLQQQHVLTLFGTRRFATEQQHLAHHVLVCLLRPLLA